MPKVSILMRSKNDKAYIRDTLRMVMSQSYSDFELLNVDSGSTDGTFEIIKEFNSFAEQIPPERYNPGRVLNAMANKSKGRILVFLNSDATPQHECWLENLIAPLMNNRKIVATFGRQLARKDAHPLVQRDYLATYGKKTAPSKISSWSIGNDSWFNLFSLANAAIKKSCWKARPFQVGIQYSEDIEWAKWARESGHEIKYVPKATVFHSHNYSFQEAWKRFYEEGKADAQIFSSSSNKNKQFLTYALIPYFSAILNDFNFCLKQKELMAFLQSPLLRFAHKFGRYQGFQDQMTAQHR